MVKAEVKKVDNFNFTFAVGKQVDIGRVRKSNQDRLIVADTIGFFGVSDGMGGLGYGEMAAEIVAANLPHQVKESIGKLASQSFDLQAYKTMLQAQIEHVNEHLYTQYNKGGKADYGATVTCALLVDDYAIFGNLGDSRAYILRRGESLRQITEDHSVAGMLVKYGEITKEEAMHHPASAQLTRFMGIAPPPKVDIFAEKLQSGDIIILCTDGVNGMVTDSEIESAVIKVMEISGCPGEVAKALIAISNRAGGRDNIGAVVVSVKCKV
ncbi:MAG: protein phosphatase 2C domain-containing protein [Firmicutes bacterium]|nr:protein phosphatase 2C domain-containing protein [Bacillota bacterium]